MIRVARQREFFLMVCNTDEQSEIGRAYIKQISGTLADGVLVLNTGISTGEILELRGGRRSPLGGTFYEPTLLVGATPAMAIKRGLSTQSAYSRTCIGEIFAVSMGMAICMISPMIELIGPMRGVTPVGSPSSIEERRSDTICRARKISVFQLKVT